MQLYVRSLVQLKWFDYGDLNYRITNFCYSTEDNRDKPSLVMPKRKNLVGGAWQLLLFLRLFPLLIGDKIKDVNHRVWEAILLLSEIVESVCAPEIKKKHIPYLQNLINEYLLIRNEIFPQIPLRPKHHYLSHYPLLFIIFGPLIRVWTLRFESKHTFFKRMIRFIRNFINVTKTLSQKHELLQSYLRQGADLRNEIEIGDTSNFIVQRYSTNIQNAIKKKHISVVT